MARAQTKRGSPEAIAKRRAARALNQLFDRLRSGQLDGRTEKKRRRLLKELKEGKKGVPLPPSDVVSHASELLRMGETLTSIRKNGVLLPPFEANEEALKAAREVQALNEYDPKAWKLLGLDLTGEKKRSRKKTRAASAKKRKKKR